MQSEHLNHSGSAGAPGGGEPRRWVIWLPPGEPILTANHPLAADRVEDHDALYPTRKALIDGLVKAGVFADDNKNRVTGGEPRILPQTHPMGHLKVVITEAAGRP